MTTTDFPAGEPFAAWQHLPADELLAAAGCSAERIAALRTAGAID